jgi:hypothetical protein|nr:MAG TPA: hypothetical protein [Crassvirales sp.]
MANYSLTVNSTFNPYSLQELLPIYQANAQAQYQAEEAFSQLQMKADQWEKLANNAQDADVYSKYKSYSNQLKEAANDVLNNGINAASRRNLMNMRAQYASNIIPIEEAYNKRQQQAQVLWQARLQDPTLIAQDPSELGLSYYMKNPSYTPQSYSGKLLTAQSAQAAQNLAKTLSSYGKGEPIDSYTNTFIQKHGLTRNDIQKYLNGETTATNKVLGAIYQQVYDSSQIGNWANENQRRQAANFIKQGMWSAIGQDTVQAMENFEARENYKFNQQLALLQAQQQQINDNLPINPTPIYTPEEQKEADEMREKYKKYFYTKNGRTYLRQKGREAYEGKVRLKAIDIASYQHEGKGKYGYGQFTLRDNISGKTTVIPIQKDKEGYYYNIADSGFSELLNSLGAQKYLGKGHNWQPGNVGNLWSKYINTGIRGDANRFMEYNYALNEEQQKAYKNAIITANLGNDKVYESTFNRKTKKFERGKSIDLADLATDDNKYTITDIRMSAFGNTAIIQDKKKGKVYRIALPSGINYINEKQRDAALQAAKQASEIAYTKKLPNGKAATKAELIQAEQDYKNAINYAYLYQSQLGIQNTIESQKYSPQGY